jgi:hypothetical protein
MIPPGHDDGRALPRALALMIGIGILLGSDSRAFGGGLLERRDWDLGTLGYGPPGLHPGYDGFGLRYHPGYGYGGHGRGVGAGGGYPFYGGPGYPHPAPPLNRLGRLEPFPYYGGPGHPSPGHPHFFGGVGPLVVDPPVIEVGSPGDLGHSSGFGPYTGARPYPETLFAPYSSADATLGLSRPERPTPEASSAAPTLPAPSTPPAARSPFARPGAGRSRDLGVEGEPFVDPDGARGLKVTAVRAGSAAARAGLRAGDVIYSINGFPTTDREGLDWVLTQTEPDGVLQVFLQSAADGKDRTIAVPLSRSPGAPRPEP